MRINSLGVTPRVASLILISCCGAIEENATEDGVVGRAPSEAENDASFNGVLQINAVAKVREIEGVKNLAASGIQHVHDLLPPAAIPVEAVKGNAMLIGIAEIHIDVEAGPRIPARCQTRLKRAPLKRA